MNIEDVVAAARESGFENVEAIKTLARKAAMLHPDDKCDARDPGSRLGGLPMLPASVAWPQREGNSLAFVAQIDLASVPTEVSEETGLPHSGLLLFFYDAEQRAWGFDPRDAGCCAVVYAPPDDAVRAASTWPRDLPEEARFTAIGLAAHASVSLPNWDTAQIEDLNLDRRQLTAYQDLLERLSGDDAWLRRGVLGGYPDQIQNDVMLECEMVSAGLYCGNEEAYRDPRMPVLRRRSGQWRLLLQVPSAESCGMMWGDAGCLYYCIRDEDLRAARFEKSWLILQCG